VSTDFPKKVMFQRKKARPWHAWHRPFHHTQCRGWHENSASAGPSRIASL